jgi:hypothetical protein
LRELYNEYSISILDQDLHHHVPYDSEPILQMKLDFLGPVSFLWALHTLVYDHVKETTGYIPHNYDPCY